MCVIHLLSVTQAWTDRWDTRLRCYPPSSHRDKVVFVDQLSDIELVQRYRKRDEAALVFLVRRYFTSIFRFLARMIGDQAMAEDLTQETFVKVWKSLSYFDLHKSFKAWLFSIARNTAIDYLRKKQTLPFSSLEGEDDASFTETIADERPLPTLILERADLQQALDQALTTHLSPVARSIVLLHETEGLTFQEIADTLQEPLNTVKSRYRRALLTLQTHLTPDGEPRSTSSSAPKSPPAT